ncbi:MAG: MarR family winged helix-turn-helix transcriptional regulator [Anaeroplasma sp.]
MFIHIGPKINRISNIIKRRISNQESINKLDKVSGTNGFILVEIYKSNNPVYQKDIESSFGITRSTTSKIISLMEKKGLLERKSCNADARLKQLVLTPLANSYCEDVIKDINYFEMQLTKDFTENEKKQLLSYLDRLLNNLKED